MKDIKSSHAGTVQQSGVNDPSVKVYTGKNNFPQSFQHPSTCLYGIVDPVGFAKCERGDVYPYKFVTDLNTFTMQSPLKSKVNMYSAAFKVPMESIYPRNWKIMLPIPNHGDDVPVDTRCLLDIRGFSDVILNRLSVGLSLNSIDDLNLWIKYIFMLESIFSDGSLFAKANMHFCSALFLENNGSSGEVPVSFDEYFDSTFIRVLKEFFVSYGAVLSQIEFDGADVSYNARWVVFPDGSPNIGIRFNDGVGISFIRAVELLRSGEYVISSFLDSDFEALFPFDISPFDFFQLNSPTFEENYNIESIVSYQLACSHFFNNPKIDFIYSAQLYRDNIESLVRYFIDFPTFVWNGVSKLYDVFSGAVFNSLLEIFSNFIGDESDAISVFFGLWQSIFGFQNSLRYGDYFTGAHPEPLAVGDVNAPVIDGTVNALDMTRKLQLTRLLNKVNITGPRFADYLRGIFGGELPQVPEDVPVRLSLEKFDVSGFEVNNTGSDQLSDDSPNITTTNLRLDDSRFMFEAQIDRPCWLVFVQYFDSHRIYSKTMDRFAFHRTRFHDFIPDLQFTGDQEIKRGELDAVDGANTVPFGYALRYMEYKQRYSYASGGFIRRLKSWAMVTDNLDGVPATPTICPEYIRSSPSEFDRFYKSISGYSLGSRFHFITFNTNVCAPYRQMVYAPEILA